MTSITEKHLIILLIVGLMLYYLYDRRQNINKEKFFNITSTDYEQLCNNMENCDSFFYDNKMKQCLLTERYNMMPENEYQNVR